MRLVKVEDQEVHVAEGGGRAGGVRMSDGQVTIKLTSDEALVLSHWLENALANGWLLTHSASTSGRS